MNRVRRQLGIEDLRMAYTGRGITVALLDTGIASHPDFDNRIVGFKDFLHGISMNYDDSGHGTHVSGILAGNGLASGGIYKGIAPETRIVMGKVLGQNGEGQISDMIHGIEWIMEVQNYYHIRILNISIGLNEVEDGAAKERLIRAVENVWEKGILVVAAAGNKGPSPMSLSPIGASRKVITVGCHEGGYFGNREDTCEAYSGRGPSLYEMKKPDIVAPGTDITSCCNKWKKSMKGYKNAYSMKSGTSMATPIVAGAAALLMEKNPAATNEEIKRNLIYTASDMHEPWAKQGWGMINLRRLLWD